MRRGAVGFVGLVVALGGWGYFQLRASLPLLDGELTLISVRQPISIHRDALGIPTIEAMNRLDVAFALGFLHAQDRFFQMDLLRRRTAGELAELFGSAALDLDRSIRVHRFRRVAQRILHEMPGREIAEIYALGVNTGLKKLGAAPFEYMLLRSQPREWLAEDTILTVLAMFVDLQPLLGERESALGLFYDKLPEELAQLLTVPGTPWDAPIIGSPMKIPEIPGAEIYDLRRLSQSSSNSSTRTRSSDHDPRGQLASMFRGAADQELDSGSNQWAISSAFTANNKALLAGDSHLDLSVPNIWYRAVFKFPDASGKQQRIVGATLPGTPTMTFGSNGSVAWCYTNSNVDYSDLIILEHPDGDTSRYLTPAGPRPFESHIEWFTVKNAPDDSMMVQWTLWGPVIDSDHQGRMRVLRWIAHDEYAVNLNSMHMELAQNVKDAMLICAQSGVPAVNTVLADREGNIGWTISGLLPKRVGHDGRFPSSWADGTRGWDGYLSPEEYPKIYNPESGRLWTANNRVVDGELLGLIGDGGYSFAARAQHIRDALFQMEAATPQDMLALQLDDRALFLQRWQKLFLEVLDLQDAGYSHLQEMRPFVKDWGGRASIESVGYRLVRNFRFNLLDATMEMVAQECFKADAQLRPWHLRSREGPLWKIIQEQPPHLLDPGYANWNELFLEAADKTLADMAALGSTLSDRTWGERNTSKIRHPLSRAVPFLGRWLDMKPHPLPGDAHMPRVQGPSHGASQRLIITPGLEEEAIFHMPCGQSGHPLSPFYRNSHIDWQEGEPAPFLPTATKHTLYLLPESN